VPGVTAADCRAAALKPTGARSVNGLPLLQREVHANEASALAATTTTIKNIAALPSTLPPLKVLVLGGIHGDEMSSVALVFRWIALAQAQPAGIQWRFVPGLNPDGLLQTKPTRVNANKVDLNRNFPTPGWQHEAAEHWANRARKDPRRWPGHTAQSEPETRFVVQTMNQWKPDLIVSIHAPYAVLDFDGPVEAPHRLGKLFLDRVGIFPGSLGNYGGMHRSVPVVTLELPHANRIPPDGEVKQMWTDLLKWADQRLVMARVEPPKTTSATAPLPVPVSVSVSAPVPAPVVTPTATAAPSNPVSVPEAPAAPSSQQPEPTPAPTPDAGKSGPATPP
jgi:murein peptide amidase A